MTTPILVTGAAGQVGGVGGLVVGALLRRGQPVRALVRREDQRAETLRATGAEVVVADLTRPADMTVSQMSLTETTDSTQQRQLLPAHPQ